MWRFWLVLIVAGVCVIYALFFADNPSQLSELFDSMLPGLISGVIASGIFLFILTGLSPRLKLSKAAVLSKALTQKDKISFKVINHTWSDLVNLKATLHTVRSIPAGNGTRNIVKKITLTNADPPILPKSKPRQRNYSDNVYVFNAILSDAQLALLKEDVTLRFRLVAKHPVSGVHKVFQQRYSMSNDTIQEGIFAAGENFDILSSQSD